MSFGHPWWLLLLAAPLLLVVWELGRRSPRIAIPLDHGTQRRGSGLGRVLLAGGILPALLLALAVLIVCRPLVTRLPKQERELTNIEFVLDVSGSMTSEFGEGTQYDAAMKSIKDFTSRRTGDAFGLTIFGNEVLRWTPLTQDVSAIRSATPFLRPELLPGHFGGTEIGKAILFCQKTLARRGEGDRLIILLSDGQSADLGTTRSRKIGANLAADHIVLYAIHIGPGAPPQDLYELCRPTKGRVFAAGNPNALSNIFAHIDRMQPVKLKPAAVERIDFFAPFATSGFAMLGLYVLSLFGLRFTPW
ncbi:MAG: VWA domain-containing protein [Planctomycetes bacterium]|nr:VWA domain-containing protein [Planctomycetota bacterium]